MINLTTNEIFKIGMELSDNLIANKLFKKNKLLLQVDDESFKKIDEDLYYRNNPDGKDFEPSFSEIDVKFPYLDIVIYKDNDINKNA